MEGRIFPRHLSWPDDALAKITDYSSGCPCVALRLGEMDHAGCSRVPLDVKSEDFPLS
jgi:hypothetical protein